MIPFFITSGHFNYAKCSYLYLQDMHKIHMKLSNDNYHLYTNMGYFTIRRSKKFYSGIWSDMTIEQTYMRNIHSRGGLTHGRGVTPATTARWITSIPLQIVIAEQLENFCNFKMDGTSHQHKDADHSRIEKDEQDVKILLQWFENHPPFVTSDHIISLSTGIIGSAEINCHEAQAKGISLIPEVIKGTFNQIKFKKSMKVLPLKSVFSKINLEDNNVVIVDAETLFRRMLLCKPSNEEFENYFNYELSPYPASLFDGLNMRKNKKSDLYDFFTPIADESLDEVYYVIDGGYLLHKIVWNPSETFKEISEKFIYYVTYNYTNCTLIFDGYPDGLENVSTKSAERLRRTKQVSPEVQIKEDAKAMSKPDKFLMNESNKKCLIEYLIQKFKASDIDVKQAQEDADVLIVKTATEKASHEKNVVIIGQDIDLVIILSMLSEEFSNVYLLKPSIGNVSSKLYNRNSFNFPQIQKYIGFIHAFSGCDTTSAFFNIGKKKFVKFICKNILLLQESIEIFIENNANSKDIESAAEKIVIALYGVKTDSLSNCRYQLFQRLSKNAKFSLAQLPPTASATKEHGFRTYYQIQQWKQNALNPLDWGWHKSKNGLMPIRSSAPPAPTTLLEQIACGCKKGCQSNCGCRKLGINCSMFCKECMGINCENVDIADISEEDVATDIDAEIDISFENSLIQEEL